MRECVLFLCCLIQTISPNSEAAVLSFNKQCVGDIHHIRQTTRICWPLKKKKVLEREFSVTGETERKITQLLCLLRKPREEETQWLQKKRKA